ncbi:MAG: tryptophan--tRNA ligase, partial [Geobacteraceae bacterium]|nr:tryptophan--tRNA ligase [Geobacteraceae bacterium]
MENKRIVSGMRPTGKLHLGHFHGVLSNWLKLQQEFECFFFAADWHSLTTEYANTEGISDSIREMVLDWLAFGIDPEKSTIFIQSQVPQHAELNLILSMITPVSWLERNPTYKEMQENLTAKDLSTFGFLGYPVLMASDIIVY